MRFLEKPDVKKEPEEVFDICVASYRVSAKPKNKAEQAKKDKIEALKKCRDLVRDDSKVYNESVPHNIKALQKRCWDGTGITADDLVEVYEKKLVSSVNGRKIYDTILQRAELDVCPICGVSDATTLDHYLPKSIYPILAVTPNNLIPVCTKCNKNKHDAFETEPNLAPIHIYFDKPIVDPWLQAEISFNPTTDKELTISFSAECPPSWDAVLSSRIEKHMKLYGLDVPYKKQAGREVKGKRRAWKSYLKSGRNILLRELGIVKESEEENDLNSWQSALYRGLIKHIDVLESWLNSQVVKPNTT